MAIYRKILAALALICGVVLVYFYTLNQPRFIAGTAPTSLKPYLVALVEGLNRANDTAHLDFGSCASLTIYPVNWTEDNSLPQLDDKHKKCAILWIGSRQNLFETNLKGYGGIWASTPLLQNFLASFHISSDYVPIFALPEQSRHNASSQYFALIGQQPRVQQILERLNLPFKQYHLNTDIQELRHDMSHIRAVIASDTKFHPSSMDIHPLFLELAQNYIPLIVPWIWPQEDTVNLFNDRVTFYQSEQYLEALLRDFEKYTALLHYRAEKAAHLVLQEFSLQRNIQRILEHRTEPNDKIRFHKPFSQTVSLNVPTAVGHYTAGDYALAQDLATYLKPKLTAVDLTFYNSLYRYPTEFNILIRGFLPPADYDLLAAYNILYLAYAQFAQDETHEILPPFEEYLLTLETSAKKVDALVVASQKLSDALNARGIRAFYIPQFTDTKRFYYDFDEELKSEVLFVGINTFYRTAVPALLKRGVKVDVYGPRWPLGIAKAEYADNQILRKYYSSAKIVLNDTREGMKQFGFISNRIFDATACGALIISDYMPEIEQIYGDSVPMYHNDEELYELVQYYLMHEDERLEKAKRAQEITLKHFTAEKAAAQFLEIMAQIKRK